MTAPDGPVRNSAPGTMTSWWSLLRRPTGSRPGPRRRLLVLPHSAAGPTALLDVLTSVPQDVEVLGLTLPGRGRRFVEPPGCTLDEVLESVRAELAQPQVETVLFGHSLGAVLAFHVARALGSGCKALVISGQVPGGCSPVLGARTSEELLDVLVTGGGTAAEVMENPALLKVVTRILAADVALGAEASAREETLRATAPLFVLGAVEDPLAPYARMTDWADRTTGTCRVFPLRGGHFALLEQRNRDLVADVLDRALRQAA
ncbi:thioesterase II family protein [Streptomyces sp. NPDC059258]|uniref:thioesterase II family protein n=1 Tax=unclassified Streptomyces TaxID=2593676 RepID=UPI00368E4A77